MEDQKGMANQEEWKEFYATHDSKDLTIAALMEANEMLGELLSRYRQSNALLRRINSDLRKLKNIQYNNDLEFQSMCQGDLVIEVDVRGDGGLPDPQAS